ncbi:MAG: hypothetical protein J0M15_14280 [Deltaproteobacteria bacterium]|nr:hypothetical protein [Deltaproteobacteria bacterium]
MRLIKRKASQFGFSVVKFSIFMQFTTAPVFADQSCTYYYEPKIDLKSNAHSIVPQKSSESREIESKLNELEQKLMPFLAEVQKLWIIKNEKNSEGTNSKNGDDLNLDAKWDEFESEFKKIFEGVNLTDLVSAVESRFEKKWTDFEFVIYRNLLVVFLNDEIKTINDSPMIDTLIKHFFNEYSINHKEFFPDINTIRTLLRLRPEFLSMFSYKNLRKKAKTPDIANSLYRDLLSIINVSIPNAKLFVTRRLSNPLFESPYQRDFEKIRNISDFIRKEITESLSSSKESLFQGQRLSHLLKVAYTLQKMTDTKLAFPPISSKDNPIFVFLKFKLSQLSSIVDGNDSKIRDAQVLYLRELVSTVFFLTEYASKDSKLTIEVKEKIVEAAQDITEIVGSKLINLGDILVNGWNPPLFLLWKSWTPSSSFGFLERSTNQK